MQHTSRIQNHPDTLIQNFFISGLSQKKLKELDLRDIRSMSSQDPEVLFTMFRPEQDCQNYLHLVHPEKIAIIQKKENSELTPTFFTFMATDQEGFNAYFHCLTFVESFNQAILFQDFDRLGFLQDLWKNSKQKAKIPKLKKNYKSQESSSNTTTRRSHNVAIGKRESVAQLNEENDEDDMGDTLVDLQRKKAALKNRIRNDKINIKTAKDIGEMLQTRSNINLSSSLPIKSKMGEDPGASALRNTTASLPSMKKLQSQAIPQDNLSRLKGGCLSVIEEQEAEKEAPNPLDNSQRRMAIRETGQSRRASKQENNNDESQIIEDVSLIDGDVTKDFIDCQDDANEYYTPIAFVIKTEIENHDIFRAILLQLYENIWNPKRVNNNSQVNTKLAFADFIANLAFLKTIPCPSFNTRFNIEFFGKTLIIDEKPFNQVPNKNQIALKVLFDFLDVQSIFYCWKALLFDKSLVLLSTQKSLQFYVAEGLKQLLFPLTWQHTYVQPVSSSLIEDLIDTPFPLIMCVNPFYKDFEYFEDLMNQEDFHKDIAIVHIDGCQRNDLKFPKMQIEGHKMREINSLKNNRVHIYDWAFGEMIDKHVDEQKQGNDFVEDIRNRFYGYLKRYLDPINECIDLQNYKADSSQCIFSNYFNIKQYLSTFEDEDDYEFAKLLSSNSQFIHFCDDAFSEEISNFKMYLAIESTENQTCMTSEQAMQISEQFKEQILRQRQEKSEKSGKKHHHLSELRLASSSTELLTAEEWNEAEQVVIDWRMPPNEQKWMLFEKLLALNEDAAVRNHKFGSENDIALNVKDFDYKDIIETIMKNYPKSLQYKAEQLSLPNTNNKIVSQNQPNQCLQNTPEILKGKAASLTRDNFVGYGRTKTGYSNQSGLYSQQSYKSDCFSDQSLSATQDQQLKISKVMYGKNGLVTFLTHLFGLFDQVDQRQFNYYFVFRKQLTTLQNLPQANDITLSQDQDFFQTEENENKNNHHEEEEPNVDIQFEKQYTTGLGYKRQVSYTSVKQQSTMLVPRQMPQHARLQCVVQDVITKFESNELTDQIQNSHLLWFLPNSWNEKRQSITRSQQFIMIKVKMASYFESVEDGVTFTFEELMKFPQSRQGIFPVIRYNSLLENISINQKQNYLDLHKKDEPKHFQLQILRSQVELERKRNKESVKNTGIHYSQMTQFLSQISKICIVEHLDNIKAEEDQQKAKNIVKKAMKPKSPQGNCAKKNSIKNLQDSGKQVKQKIQTNNNEIKKKTSGSSFSWKKILTLNTCGNSNQNSRNSKVKTTTSLPNSVKNTTQSMKIKSPKKGQVLDTIPQRDDTITSRDTLVSVDREARETPTKLFASTPKRPGVTFAVNDSNPDSQNISGLSRCTSDGSIQTLEPINKTMAPNTTKNQQTTKFDFGLALDKFKKCNTIKYKKVVASDAVRKSVKLITNIVEFFESSKEHMLENGKYGYQKEEKTRLMQELYDLKKSSFKLKSASFDFSTAFDDLQDEVAKQCFWLNILNFMVLLKLAEILLIMPSILKLLNNVNIWQEFLHYNYIYVQNTKLSAYHIWHSIIRQKLPLPKMGKFMYKPLNIEDFEEEFRPNIVQEPHPLTAFGLFLPLTGMPKLQIYEKNQFDKQLRTNLSKICKNRLRIHQSSHLIRVPKYLLWYKQDFGIEELETLLQFMIDQSPKCRSITPEETHDFLETIRAKNKEKRRYINSQYTFDIKMYQWQIDIRKLKKLDKYVYEVKTGREEIKYKVLPRVNSALDGEIDMYAMNFDLQRDKDRNKTIKKDLLKQAFHESSMAQDESLSQQNIEQDESSIIQNL